MQNIAQPLIKVLCGLKIKLCGAVGYGTGKEALLHSRSGWMTCVEIMKIWRAHRGDWLNWPSTWGMNPSASPQPLVIFSDTSDFAHSKWNRDRAYPRQGSFPDSVSQQVAFSSSVRLYKPRVSKSLLITLLSAWTQEVRPVTLILQCQYFKPVPSSSHCLINRMTFWLVSWSITMVGSSHGLWPHKSLFCGTSVSSLIDDSQGGS